LNSTARYYLDTSAQIERFGGPAGRRKHLKALLQGRLHVTSSQVLREWNTIVFGACVALRNAVANANHWREVVPELRKGFGRTASRNWMVADWITRNDTADLTVIAMRAQDFQRVRARAMFNAGVQTVRDGTECRVARRRPNPSSKGWRYRPTCKKSEDICSQPRYLEENLSKARAAATALKGSSRPDDAKMGKNALQALNELSTGGTKGKACYGANRIGGDICIALECGQDEVLVTTDESFDLICPALGLSHIRVK
jgi:hypothetical protein